MPVLYIPPPPPPVPPAIPPPQPHEYGGKTITWISPAGDEILLTDDYGFRCLPGRTGFGRVDHDIISDKLPDGTNWIQNYRPSTRVLNIPLALKTRTPDEFSEALNRLDVSFQHKPPGVSLPQPGTIRVSKVDGSYREIKAYYQGGLDNVEDILDDQMLRYAEFPQLEFWCPSPTFTSNIVRWTWGAVIGTADPFYPIYPIRLAPSDLGNTKSWRNDSQEPVYPVWEFKGPGTPRVENLLTGEFIDFAEDIPGGVTVTVDTRPISIAPTTGQTVTDNLGNSWWDRMEGTWWKFGLGDQQIEFTMANATESSRLTLTYQSRHGRGW